VSTEASPEVSAEQHAKLHSFFVLTIISEFSDKPIAHAFLTCGPAGGDHPYPVDACKQLSKVNGHIEKIPAWAQTVVATGNYSSRF
jgi:hypothetical protein